MLPELPRSPARLLTLECMRGAAAFSVVIAHASSLIGQCNNCDPSLSRGWIAFSGNPAVELFFVLSGFVMAKAHSHERGIASAIHRFVSSRITRILPSFLIINFMCFLQIKDQLEYSFYDVIGWFAMSPFSKFDLNPVLWTLKLEIGFYIVSIFYFFKRLSGALIIICFIYLIVLAINPMFLNSLSGSPSRFLLYKFIIFGVDYLLGFCGGVIFRKITNAPYNAMYPVVGGTTIIIARLYLDEWGLSYGPPNARFVYAAGYSFILIGLATLESRKEISLNKNLKILGDMSYPLYLIHVPVIVFILSHFGAMIVTKFQSYMIFGSLLAVPVVCAAAYTYFIDKPILSMIRNLSKETSMAVR